MDDFEILRNRRFARWYMRKLRDARNKWRDKAVKLNEKVEQLEFFYEGNGFKKRGLNNSIQIADYIKKLEKQLRTINSCGDWNSDVHECQMYIRQSEVHNLSDRLNNATEIIRQLLLLPYANNEEVYGDVTSILNKAEQFLKER